MSSSVRSGFKAQSQFEIESDGQKYVAQLGSEERCV